MTTTTTSKRKKRNPTDDTDVWAATVAHRFARHPSINLPAGNLWEPGIARALAKAVNDGRHTRDGVEMLMALQLGIAAHRADLESLETSELYGKRSKAAAFNETAEVDAINGILYRRSLQERFIAEHPTGERGWRG